VTSISGQNHATLSRMGRSPSHGFWGLVSALLLFLASIAAADDSSLKVDVLGERDDVYRNANAAFESNLYPQAIEYYEKLVSENHVADSLYLNLGASHYRHGSPGRAALWFKRALHLNPAMPEVRQNFEFLRRQLGLLEFAEQGWEKLLLRLPLSLFRWTGSLFIWLALLSLLATVFGKKNTVKPLLIIGLIFSLSVATLTFGLGRYRTAHLAPENFATVVVPESSALVAPAPDSAPVISLPEGSEVRIIQDTGPWIYALIPGNMVGWIHHTSIEKNWPIPAQNSK